MSSVLKNFKLGPGTVAQLEECVQTLGLPSATLAVKVAIAHLHACRDTVDLRPILVGIRERDLIKEEENDRNEL